MKSKSDILDNPGDIANQSQILVSLQEAVGSLDMRISDIFAEKNTKKIKDHHETAADSSGCFKIPKMWGLL